MPSPERQRIQRSYWASPKPFYTDPFRLDRQLLTHVASCGLIDCRSRHTYVPSLRIPCLLAFPRPITRGRTFFACRTVVQCAVGLPVVLSSVILITNVTCKTQNHSMKLLSGVSSKGLIAQRGGASAVVMPSSQALVAVSHWYSL